jgi:hypothetical protein
MQAKRKNEPWGFGRMNHGEKKENMEDNLKGD